MKFILANEQNLRSGNKAENFWAKHQLSKKKLCNKRIKKFKSPWNYLVVTSTKWLNLNFHEVEHASIIRDSTAFVKLVVNPEKSIFDFIRLANRKRKKSNFRGTKPRKTQWENKQIAKKLQFAKTKQVSQSYSWTLSLQAWVLQQLGRKPSLQNKLALRGPKNSSLQKLGPGQTRTTWLCRLNQLCYLYARCSGRLIEFEFIITKTKPKTQFEQEYKTLRVEKKQENSKLKKIQSRFPPVHIHAKTLFGHQIAP